MIRHASRRKLVLAALLALIVSVSAYAFTAANTVPVSNAGDGTGTISGYTVSAVAYVLAADAANIDKVTFTLSAPATQVKAKVLASSTTYTDCTNTAGNNFSCDFATDPTVTSADQLRVIATS